MRRTISTLSPDMGIADPGAMKSWEATLLTHNKVTDFPHPSSLFLDSTALPSLPSPLKDLSTPPFSSSPQPSPFPSRPDDLAHALCRC